MSRVFFFVASLLLVSGTASAEAFRVDDSGTVVEGGRARMKWDEIAPSAGGSNAQVTGRKVVQARLDLAPWQGRMARIYLTWPMSAAPPFQATWATRGPLLPGALRSGERTLVFAGPITAPRLEDVMQFTLTADGRRLRRDEQLEFAFEIEPEAP